MLHGSWAATGSGAGTGAARSCHDGELHLPGVIGGRADPELPADIGDGGTTLRPSESVGNLFLGKLRALYGALSCPLSETTTGSFSSSDLAKCLRETSIEYPKSPEWSCSFNSEGRGFSHSKRGQVARALNAMHSERTG